ncbi:MAG: DUF2283 domain-containing protein [Bacteroidetes bacterium]|nr:DUF2283 domain-containing protein [Bacteroidota bacterium]
MKITYDTTNDLLYIRFDNTEQTITNVAVNDNIMLDITRKINLLE